MKAELIRKTFPRIRSKIIGGELFYQVDARKTGTNGKQETFKLKSEAEKRAGEIAAQFAANGHEGLALPGELRFMATTGAEMLKPYGATVLQACEHYRDFLAEREKKKASETVEALAKVWYDFKAAGTEKKLRKDTLIGIRRGQLELGRAFGNRRIAEIEKADVRGYIGKQKIAIGSKRGLRALFSNFWNWAIDFGHATENPTEGLAYATGNL